MSNKTNHFGRRLSEESRLKISKALKGYKNFLGKRHTEETKLKISESKMGKTSWNKGKKFSEETRKKMSKARKGRVSPMKGKKHTIQSIEKIKEARSKQVITEETKIKLSIINSGKNNPMFGKHLIGEHSGNWRGGVTPINTIIRQSSEYVEWRNIVFERDNYTCQTCGERGGKLEADHIKLFSIYPELRFDTNNGQTLCKLCHNIKTKQDLKENWINQYKRKEMIYV